MKQLWYSPPEGMLVHRRVALSSMWSVPIYTTRWRETMWSKVSCPRKQYNNTETTNHSPSNHPPSHRKSNMSTTTTLRLHTGLFFFSIDKLPVKIVIVVSYVIFNSLIIEWYYWWSSLRTYNDTLLSICSTILVQFADWALVARKQGDHEISG